MLIVYGIKYSIEYAVRLKYLYLIIAGYFILCFLLYQIKRKFKNKVFDFIVNIVYLPILFLYGFMIVAIPLLSAQLYLFFFFALSFLIPMLIYIFDELFFLTELRTGTWCFIILSIGTITATLFQKQISFITFKVLPFTARKSEKINRVKLTQLCEYIVSKKNIKFTIYFLFFIALITFNIFGFQKTSLYGNPNIDKAILQSFVTFIAFEKMASYLKETEFKPSNLLSLIKSSVFNETEIMTGKKTTGNNV